MVFFYLKFSCLVLTLCFAWVIDFKYGILEWNLGGFVGLVGLGTLFGSGPKWVLGF